MSIIYDALKKVEESSNKDLGVKTEKKANPKFKIYLLYLPIVCLGFFIANILLNFFATPLKNNTNIVTKSQSTVDLKQDMNTYQAASKKMSTLDTTVPAPIEQNTKAESQPAPSLILNGVFFSGNEGYALINNQIVKEGDKINGATVVRIALDEVELKSQDSILKLSTQSSIPKVIESETNAVKSNIEKYTVQTGDTLEKISNEFYGTTEKWTKIYEANKNILKGSDKIYPGQVIDIPLDASTSLSPQSQQIEVSNP